MVGRRWAGQQIGFGVSPTVGATKVAQEIAPLIRTVGLTKIQNDERPNVVTRDLITIGSGNDPREGMFSPQPVQVATGRQEDVDLNPGSGLMQMTRGGFKLEGVGGFSDPIRRR